jgi:hypothetical protein
MRSVSAYRDHVLNAQVQLSGRWTVENNGNNMVFKNYTVVPSTSNTSLSAWSYPTPLFETEYECHFGEDSNELPLSIPVKPIVDNRTDEEKALVDRLLG